MIFDNWSPMLQPRVPLLKHTITAPCKYVLVMHALHRWQNHHLNESADHYHRHVSELHSHVSEHHPHAPLLEGTINIPHLCHSPRGATHARQLTSMLVSHHSDDQFSVVMWCLFKRKISSPCHLGKTASRTTVDLVTESTSVRFQNGHQHSCHDKSTWGDDGKHCFIEPLLWRSEFTHRVLLPLCGGRPNQPVQHYTFPSYTVLQDHLHYINHDTLESTVHCVDYHHFW